MNTKIPTILHVDDDENDRVLLKFAHERAGVPINIVSVEDGEEAVSYLKGEGAYYDRVCSPPPALVLLDLKMPRADGFSVLDWIRRQRSFQDLPVIVLSSSGQDCDLLRALRSGATSYFVKPVAFASLVGLVKKIYFRWLADTPETVDPPCADEAPGRALLTYACSLTTRPSPAWHR